VPYGRLVALTPMTGRKVDGMRAARIFHVVRVTGSSPWVQTARPPLATSGAASE
jgi:hypothetical protein